MALPITNDQYRTSQQPYRTVRIKINLLNYNYQIVDSFEGYCTGGSITVNAESELRRTASITMVVTDKSFNPQPGGKIFLDKYIQIYIGIDDIRTNNTVWNNMGIYLINNPTRTYDHKTNTLTFQALDLMSKLTGLRNGNIEGAPTIIPVGSSIREAMISCVDQLGGFKKYVIDDNPQKVPIEIKVERETTVADLIKQLRDITPNYQVYFDVNGVFHYEQIPTGNDDPVLVDMNTWENIVTSVDITTDFEYVKNSIEVWGKCHNPSVYVENITIQGNTYVGTAEGLDPNTFTEYVIVGFIPPSPIDNPQLKIGDLGPFPIVNEDGTPHKITNADGKLYIVLQVMKGGKQLQYLGKQQIYASIEDTDPDSPFNINSSVGRILKVCTGGEYDVIWTDDLAYQRCQYELYLHDRIQDTITLKCVPLYYLQENTKIEYINEELGIVPQKWNAATFEYDLPSHFMVRSFTIGLQPNSTMNIICNRCYPFYWWGNETEVSPVPPK